MLKRSCNPVIDLTTGCVTSRPPNECVISRPFNKCVISQPPSDCVVSQPPSDDDTFNEDMDQTSHDGVLAARLRFSSEPEHTKRCGRKRKKCVSVTELPKQEEQPYSRQEEQPYSNNNMAIEEEEMVNVVRS